MSTSNSNASSSARGDAIGVAVTDAVTATTSDDVDRARFERACEATPAKIAKRFAAMHAGRICHVPGRDWFRWDGTRWLCDDTACGHELTACIEETSEAVARDARRYADDTKRAASLWRAVHQMLDRKGHRAVLEYAATDPQLAVSAPSLDAHPGLVNFANGTLDAETGALRPHRKDDLLTRVISIPFDPSAQCPTWDAFLDYALNGDHELIAWLQRCAGYSMTGYTNARALWVLVGHGRNGKSTLLDTLQAVLAPYHVNVQAASLMAKQSVNPSGASPDIARLAGARYVTAGEIAKGRSLDDELIKQLTGGVDMITARHLYRGAFDFRPQCKIWLATNHAPSTSDTSPAMRDRMRIVPLTRRVTQAQRDADPDFAARITSELPGIAAWMVRGLEAYMRAGQSLGPLPAAVAAASNQWAQDQDPVAQWMSEACEVGRSFEETHGALYASYRASFEQSGHNRAPLSSIALGRALRRQQNDDGAPLFGERNRPELVWTGLRLRTHGAPT